MTANIQSKKNKNIWATITALFVIHIQSYIKLKEADDPVNLGVGLVEPINPDDGLCLGLARGAARWHIGTRKSIQFTLKGPGILGYGQGTRLDRRTRCAT
jgi:hypothetical protein